MKTTVKAAILDRLYNDTILQGYLGGAYVRLGHISDTDQVPVVTIEEIFERAEPRVGYNSHYKRDNFPTIQIDIQFHGTEPLLKFDQIEERIDVLLFKMGISGTMGWKRVTSSNQYDDDTETRIRTLRYQFQYVINDT